MVPENDINKQWSDLVSKWKSKDISTQPQSVIASSQPTTANTTSSSDANQTKKPDYMSSAVEAGQKLTEGFFKALGEQEKTTRKIQEDTGKSQAEAMNELNKNKIAQAINPLSTLISSYRSVL